MARVTLTAQLAATGDKEKREDGGASLCQSLVCCGQYAAQPPPTHIHPPPPVTTLHDLCPLQRRNITCYSDFVEDQARFRQRQAPPRRVSALLRPAKFCAPGCYAVPSQAPRPAVMPCFEQLAPVHPPPPTPHHATPRPWYTARRAGAAAASTPGRRSRACAPGRGGQAWPAAGVEWQAGRGGQRLAAGGRGSHTSGFGCGAPQQQRSASSSAAATAGAVAPGQMPEAAFTPKRAFCLVADVLLARKPAC